jgi:asparaginyl-tRNA synthetase
MKIVRINEISQFAGQRVILRGWLANKRSSGKLHFLQMRDGSGTIQCVVFFKDVTAEVFTDSGSLTLESSFQVEGEVRRDERSPIGFEIGVLGLQIISLAQEYPIGKKEHGVGFLMEQRHLWLRSAQQHAILTIRGRLSSYIRNFFDDRGFLNTDTPIFTPASCEGTTTLFPVDYFGENVFLTQSGQLYGEALAKAFGRIYSFGPTFRAEKSKTRRHLMEFWMVEPEAAFMNLEEDMELAEDFIIYLVERVLTTCGRELEILERDISKLANVKKPFPRIHYRDAWQRLRKLGSGIAEGSDFGGEDETILTNEFDRPIIVHRFPAAIKAFYMKKDPEEALYSLSMDVLAPEGYGEIIGGGAREESLERLQDEIKRHGLDERDFSWYLDLRRYGSTPSAGFGLGLERALSWICGLHHVRETIPFPRLLDRTRP